MVRSILFAFGILFSLPTWASVVLQCHNPVTGAALTLSDVAGGADFTLNAALVNSLLRQGSSAVVNHGRGNANWSRTQFYFNAGESKGYDLSIYAASGGIKVSYVYYADYTAGKPTTEFYFNPGECRFHQP